MKRILTLLLLTGTMYAASLSEQTARLNKALWVNQKLFGLTDLFIVLEVKHPAGMQVQGVWGDMFVKDGLPYVEVVALEDFPPSFPAAKRIAMQNKILQHEVMHIVMTQLGVPDKAQDALIEGLQPGMQVIR